MGRFVHRQAVQLLVPCAAVVNFVKIHAVQLADGLGHGVLLIKQRTAACYRHQRTVGAAQRQLKHLRVFHRNVENLARIGVQFHRCPAEAGAVIQFLFVQRRTCGVGHGQPPAVGDARVHPQRHRAALGGHGLGQGRASGVQRVLWRSAAAQVGKADHSRGRRQRQQRQNFLALPFRLRGRGRRGRGSLGHAGGQRQGVAVCHDIPHRKQQQHEADGLSQAD